MAETLLSFGVQKLWDLLVQESDRFREVDEQLTELKSDLNLLRSFLKDADAKKHASALVRNCVEEIKEIVFDTEDIIEIFLLKEELRKASGIKKCMRRVSCIIVDRKQIASDMGGMSKRISKVIRDMQSFGVQQMIVDGSRYLHPLQEKQREMRKTFPSNSENDLVGLEENVKKLVGYLVDEDNIQVVSITGMGGIGKTTLARQIFNHEMVKTHFDAVVWVCVSQQFTKNYVWETILHNLSSKQLFYRNEDELQKILFKLLETSNSLIVLDDMWKEEDWDRIKPVFPTKGWKVLLTSRNEGVALRADPSCVTLRPECLAPEASWTLFRRIAFPREDTMEFKVDEMEELRNTHCIEWNRIYENIKSHIVGGTSFNDKNISSVYHILSLSFEELPIYLKHCFLYLAHFPEDYVIDVGVLSGYWAAERIPRPRCYDGASIRDVADGFIEELVKRNIVISKRDVTTSRFHTCHLHDMMREVSFLKAEEDNFLQIVDHTSNANSISLCRSRRLAVHISRRSLDFKNPKLRSLLFMKHIPKFYLHESRSWLTSLRLMRVLDISRAEFEGGELPSGIGNLVHLRYLSLYLALVSRLPSSMRNLKQLLYLNICVASRSPLYMPNFLKEMRELRYLCFPLREHLDDKTKLELGNLVNLETLENFSTAHGSMRDLQDMTRLRVLSIFIKNGCNVETLSSSLSEMRHLENLTIEYSKVYAPTNYEEGFVLKCVHLKQLKLSIHMPRLPDKQHFPSHLTTIDLYFCRLKKDQMPILEKLLQLKEVRFESQSFSGKKMVCSGGGFPQLQELVLSGLHAWEEWVVEEGSMPFLHTLSVNSCHKLKELPDGLRLITSLKQLEIKTMDREFTKKLSGGGEDYYKIQHIPLLKIDL